MARKYTIAVDFDGTIVTHRYPKIGEEIPDAVETIKRLIKDGHRLILWSVREGELLDEAIAWCEERGITFFASNKDYPEEKSDDKDFSRKLKADIFIDDRNIGGLPTWPSIYTAITNDRPHAPQHVTTVIDPKQEEMMKRYQAPKRRSIFSRK